MEAGIGLNSLAVLFSRALIDDQIDIQKGQQSHKKYLYLLNANYRSGGKLVERFEY